MKIDTLIKNLNSKFTSGNDVPVTRASINRDEYGLIIEALYCYKTVSKALEEETSKNQKPEVPNTMITVDGKKFRCICGCNVFHKMKKDDDIYICNACGSEFEAK